MRQFKERLQNLVWCFCWQDDLEGGDPAADVKIEGAQGMLAARASVTVKAVLMPRQRCRYHLQLTCRTQTDQESRAFLTVTKYTHIQNCTIDLCSPGKEG